MEKEVPLSKKKSMSVLRRHKILRDDVRRVIAHLKAHKTITKNDVLNRPRLKKKKDAGPNEEIPWVHTDLMGSWQKKGLKPGPNNSAVLYAKEHDEWKLVVPEEDVESYLRKSMLDPKSTMPLGRDSAYYHVQRQTVGISRRALYKFLEKQGVLQITKNIPNETQKAGIWLETRGFCETDLIEGKGRDLHENYGMRGDWYWIALVDVLTGFGLVGTTTEKTAKEVAAKLNEMLDVMEYNLGSKVHTISSDHGSEFMSHTRKLLKKRKIKQKMVPRASRVEKFNQDFQRNFYRLLRLRRGNFNAIEDQALELTNNTRSKWTKKTPKECLDIPDATLADLYNIRRQKRKAYKGHGPKRPEVGMKARHLVKLRKNMRPMLTIKGQARLYKSYHGRHFTKQVYTIRDVKPPHPPEGSELPPNSKPTMYFLHGRWFHRDQILVITGTDAETERQVAARPKRGVN